MVTEICSFYCYCFGTLKVIQNLVDYSHEVMKATFVCISVKYALSGGY